MLRSLSIRNYVLIDSLEIDFPEGLVIITGQTGAGKSIILGALSLLLGARADASAIAGGADSCVVEAVFGVDESIEAFLEDNDLETGGGIMTIRRVVNRSGRSRAFINDCPVNVQLLSSISSRLVDIHSQHQNLLLADRKFQLSLLDMFAGNKDLLSLCRNCHESLTALRKELSEVEARLKDISAGREYNEARLRQLEDARLRDGEIEELEQEQLRLANAEEIKSFLCSVEEAISPGDDVRPSMDAILRSSVQLLDKASAYIPQTTVLSERLAASRIEIADILDEVSAINSRIDVAPERLRAVEDRLSQLYGLMKKHSCHSVTELIEVRDNLAGELYDSSMLETRRAELLKELDDMQASLEEAATRLHESREEASGRFSASVTASLHFLELERAVFQVRLDESPLGADGRDAVSFLFSASGASPVEVGKCASGGELSRIMLSLKCLMSKLTSMPTLIFDEIDSGVSGSVADRMGAMICDMGADMQVFAITHLPQVAAKGDAHYLVTRDVGPDGRDVSSIRPLDHYGRVMEIARMLSGSVVTSAAIANAESLLAD